MKHLKSGKSLLFGGIFCAIAAVISVTVAYNSDNSTIRNEFGVGQYKTVFTEQFTSPNNWKPGDETTKTFTVKNETDTDIKVRIKYKENWRNALDTKNLPAVKDGVALADVVLQNLEDWELKGDGYYYYKTPLAPNATTSSLFQKVIFNHDANLGADNICARTTTSVECTKPDDKYEGATYHLIITAETIQADEANQEWAFAAFDTGKNVNQALKRLIGNDSAEYYTYTTFGDIAVVDELPDTIDPSSASRINLAVDGSDPIYAYDDGEHNIYIHADGRTLYANEDCTFMFAQVGASSLIFSDSFDTSLVKNMYNMFGGYPGSSFDSITFSDSFDTSSVTDMSYMFNNVRNLTSLTLPNSFDTSNVTNMGSMFHYMADLTSLTLPDSFDTSNVTNMASMFSSMLRLAALTLPDSFDTSSVKSMSHMFYWMRGLTSLTLPDSFDTSSVTDMSGMFDELLHNFSSLTLPAAFVINNNTHTTDIFGNYPDATLNASADESVKALWPGAFRD